jgi:hypothetical protein
MYDLDVVLDDHLDFQDVYIYVSVPSRPLDPPLHVSVDDDDAHLYQYLTSNHKLTLCILHGTDRANAKLAPHAPLNTSHPAWFTSIFTHTNIVPPAYSASHVSTPLWPQVS